MKMSLLCCLCLTFFNPESHDWEAVGSSIEKLREAMVAVHKPTLAELTSPALSYGHSNGVIENQDEFIASLTSGKYKFLSIALDDQTIEVIGDMAVVRHRFFAHTHDAGKAQTTVHLHVLTIWKKTDGEWVLIARQAVKV